MRLIIISLLFISHLAQANSKDLRERALKLIPNELAELSKNDSFEQLKEKFKDKIIEVKNEKVIYLKYFKKDNDVTIGFENGKFSYTLVSFNQSDKGSLYKRDLDQLSEDEKKLQAKKAIEKAHEKGRDIDLIVKDQSIKFKFKNNSSRDIKSILIWNKGDEMP